MSDVRRAQRPSRAVEIVSPSLAPRETESAAAAPPQCSPSLLGHSEAPLLPGEDDEDDSDEWEDAVEVGGYTPPVAVAPTLASPSLAPVIPSDVDARPSAQQVPGVRSPSLFEGMPPPMESMPAGSRLVRVKDKVVHFKRAPSKRASRAARPSDPSPRARDVCKTIIQEREQELKSAAEPS